MVVALNIGNTSISIGGFEKKELIFHGKIATQLALTADQYACEIQSLFQLYRQKDAYIEGVIISCVVPALLDNIKEAMKHLTDGPILTVSAGVKTGINIKTDTPKQLGTDCVCAAAWVAKNNTLPCVIVLIETATTFVLLNEKADLLGSAIALGPQLSLETLHEKAAQLPAAKLKAPARGVIGKTTVEALRSGAVLGAAAMIEGMVARFEKELGCAVSVVADGMYASAIVPFCNREILLDETVVLKGLNQIFWKNNLR